jgi:hypothetical protein
MNALPKWYYPVTVAALLWNLLGCAAYLSDVMLTAADVAKMNADQQALYASRPAWAVAATAVAVWAGALGCLGLILRKRWAFGLLVASLVALLVQDFGLFVLADTVRIAGPGVLVMQGLVLVVAIALVWLARRAIAREWIR